MSKPATTPFLPYARQSITDGDVQAVIDVLRSDWLTTGPGVPTFERALAQAVDAKEAVACANGTAALHLALTALDVEPGSVAVVPAITFVATANAARLVGMEVVFADVDARTGLMTPESFEDALRRAAGKPVRVVLPVDLAGQTPAKVEIAAIATRRGITVVDDSAHAVGSAYEADGAWHPVGSARHAAMASFSFHAVKNITTGEGGAVCTNDGTLAARLRLLRNHGLTRDAADYVTDEGRNSAPSWYYELVEPAFNYRLTDFQCALGVHQLQRLPEMRTRRAALADRYDQALRHMAPVVRTPVRVPNCRPCWHLYAVHIDFAAAGRSRQRVVDIMRAHGVGTQVHYIPVYRHPYYQRHGAPTRLPGAEAYYAGTLSLPMFASMRDEDCDRAVAALARALSA